MVRLFRDIILDGPGGDVEYLGQPASLKFKDGYPLYYLVNGEIKSMVIPAALAEEFLKTFGEMKPEQVNPTEISTWIAKRKLL